MFELSPHLYAEQPNLHWHLRSVFDAYTEFCIKAVRYLRPWRLTPRKENFNFGYVAFLLWLIYAFKVASGAISQKIHQEIISQAQKQNSESATASSKTT